MAARVMTIPAAIHWSYLLPFLDFLLAMARPLYNITGKKTSDFLAEICRAALFSVAQSLSCSSLHEEEPYVSGSAFTFPAPAFGLDLRAHGFYTAYHQRGKMEEGRGKREEGRASALCPMSYAPCSMLRYERDVRGVP